MGPLGFAFLANALKAVFRGCTPTNMRDMDAIWGCAGLYACCAQKPVAGIALSQPGHRSGIALGDRTWNHFVLT